METEKLPLPRLPPIGSGNAQDISPRHMKKYQGLTGPKYTIASNQAALKYSLPPPHVLKPYQDTNAGGLETWPAHATGQGHTSTSLALTKDKQLVLVDEEAMGKPRMVPKPKFLDQLEEFLKKELSALGVDQVHPSELRLQAYREVFEYLIEDFKTYKPLLSAVKNEYEMMLSYQRETIRQMEPLKQMLVTVSEQCDQKIMALRDQEKQEMVDLKNENKRLFKKIDTLRQDQLSLEAQVDKLQEELAAEYLKYRDECDARKILISDMNDLRNQQEDMVMSQQAMEEEEEKDDPITLRIALKKSREDEAAATHRLNDMIANYGDVIPRREYEGLQKTHEVHVEKMETMEGDFNKLKDEHEVLLEQYKQVLQQRDDFYMDLERRKENTTPRPNWERCSDFVPGGQMRWKELSEGKTSDQIVDILLGEISGDSTDTGGAEYFDGQGTGPTIPKYLQYEGRVRNRRLGKRDCTLLIRDIWREKAANDAEKTDGVRDKMADFLHTYLQRRFGIEQMIVEWGYNLHDACQRYSHADTVGLFWNVLTGEADEEVYHSQLQTIHKLLNTLTKLDMERGNTGELNKEDFKGYNLRDACQRYSHADTIGLLKCLTDVLTNFEEENVTMLTNAAETELEAKEAETLDYKALFMEDDEGKTGPFLDELKHQIKNERMQYADDVKQELGTTSPVTPEELKRALATADPAIDQPQLDKYVCWAFNVDSPDKLIEVEALEQSVIVSKLQNGNVKRIGKK